MNKSIKVCMNGLPGWLGNYVQRRLYDDPQFEIVRGLYYGETHPDTAEGSKVQYIAGDVKNYNDCLALTKDMDVLIHIVGVIHPKNIKEFYSINVKGTDNIIRAAIANGVKRIIHISSNSVYGSQPYTMNELTNENPYMNYGKSKAMGADIVTQKCLASDTETVILVPCWFYGEGQPARQTKLFKMIEKGKPMIFGDGKNMRSMTYIGNLSDAIIKAIEMKMAFPMVETYWIADETPYSTNDIYKTIFLELKGWNKLEDIVDDFGVWKPRYLPSFLCKIGRIGDKILQKLGLYNKTIHVLGEMDQNIECDIATSKRDLKWSPKVSLAEGMRRSIKWCRDEGKL